MSHNLRNIKAWAKILLSILAPIPLILGFTWIGVVCGLALAALVVIFAWRDRVDALRAEPLNPDMNSLLREHVSEPPAVAGSPPVAGPESDGAPRPQRTVLLLIMAVVILLGVTSRVVPSLLSHNPDCGGSSLDTIMDGAKPPPSELSDALGSARLAQNMQTALCADAARSDVIDGSHLIAWALGTVVCTALEVRFKKKRVWLKLPWFPLLAYLSTPPALWLMNLFYAGAGLTVGVVVLALVQNRTRLDARRDGSKLSYRKAAAVALGVAVLVTGGVVANNYRVDAACLKAAKSTLDPDVPPKQKVSHSVELQDRFAIQEAALNYFLQYVVEDPAEVDQDSAIVILDKVAIVGQEGVALFTYQDGLQRMRGIGLVFQEPDYWTVGNIITTTIWDEPIRRGSGSFVFMPHNESLGGYIDPSATKVQSVDSCGAVIDSDVPTHGATIVIVKGVGQVRSFRGSTLLTANPISNNYPAGEFGPLTAESRKVADRFVRALLEEGWSEAASYAAGEDKVALVRPFWALLNGRFRAEGAPSQVGGGNGRTPGYLYPLKGPEGVATLGIQMVDTGEGRGWEVGVLNIFARAPS